MGNKNCLRSQRYFHCFSIDGKEKREKTEPEAATSVHLYRSDSARLFTHHLTDERAHQASRRPTDESDKHGKATDKTGIPQS